MNDDVIFYKTIEIFMDKQLKLYRNRINEKRDNLKEVKENYIESCRGFMYDTIKINNFKVTADTINNLQNLIQIKSNELK